MKKWLLLLLFAFAMPSGSDRLLAIPQTVGGFLGAVGNPKHLPIEEWFKVLSNWDPGAFVPGTWATLSSEATKMSMDKPGPVFGVSACSATITRDANGLITEVQVVFDAETSKIPKSDLLKRIKANAALFATASKQADNVFSIEGMNIQLTPAGADRIVASMTRIAANK